MAEQTIYKRWDEAVSSRPVSRDAFKGMHLAVLRQAVHEKPTDDLHTIQFETQDFVLFESKGNLRGITGLTLPAGNMLWMGLQLHGELTLPHAVSVKADQMFSFVGSEAAELLTLAAVRQWTLFIGVRGASRQQLLSELPALREHMEQQQAGVRRNVPISHVERKLLQNLTKTTFGPFSTLHRLGLLIQQLYTGYLQQLSRQVETLKEQADVQLYHKAIAYIRDNYMNEGINRDQVAGALNCSLRRLHRAFEGRPASVNVTILTFRIYKGRELLRDRPELSVEQIALMLHFFDLSHFIHQYKKSFHHTPRQERKKMLHGKNTE